MKYLTIILLISSFYLIRYKTEFKKADYSFTQKIDSIISNDTIKHLLITNLKTKTK